MDHFLEEKSFENDVEKEFGAISLQMEHISSIAAERALKEDARLGYEKANLVLSYCLQQNYLQKRSGKWRSARFSVNTDLLTPTRAFVGMREGCYMWSLPTEEKLGMFIAKLDRLPGDAQWQQVAQAAQEVQVAQALPETVTQFIACCQEEWKRVCSFPGYYDYNGWERSDVWNMVQAAYLYNLEGESNFSRLLKQPYFRDSTNVLFDFLRAKAKELGLAK
jgi:hypothetical protein